ncbi:hypothetical protein VTL71DRAFT_34 [Oculimacula yallundae]|uniref:Uncharacterized protein n=1 Tax=Oculimacula yallundae TaxID=86028 RepID=A0ABR4CZU0_9HELO
MAGDRAAYLHPELHITSILLPSPVPRGFCECVQGARASASADSTADQSSPVQSSPVQSSPTLYGPTLHVQYCVAGLALGTNAEMRVEEQFFLDTIHRAPTILPLSWQMPLNLEPRSEGKCSRVGPTWGVRQIGQARNYERCDWLCCASAALLSPPCPVYPSRKLELVRIFGTTRMRVLVGA